MKVDMINAPPHYTKGAIQFLDYLKQQLSKEGYLGFLEASVMKYMHRHKLKDANIEDLEKANFYLNRLIEEYKNL
tara:strand:- start:922 stop:1146 length:225 start_codon:yes stop_codon:yes gene_type:complete